MVCSNCGFENAGNANFCIGCGTSISNNCPECGNVNLVEAIYCSQCGFKLQEKTSVSQNEQLGVESRQLTILFCDIVDFTSLSEQLESEDLHDVVRLYQEACAEAVNQYGGYLAKYLGDGLLIYFGYPKAHEDDADRAVRAGLQILKAVKELSGYKSIMPKALKVRIGIHTGQVMAGEMGVEGAREQWAILGEAPNIASRLLDIASPDTVVISSSTYRLVQGIIDCKMLGEKSLKGVSTPIEVYEVRGDNSFKPRFRRSENTSLSSFVGREIELELLSERWEYAKDGSGQVVMISGEAGIGKSRLVQAFKERLSNDHYLKIESHCSHYFQNTALHPIIENLNRQFVNVGDDYEDKVSVLEEALIKHGFSVDEYIPLLAPLLSIPIPERFALKVHTPEMQKQRTMDVLLQWSIAESHQKPILRIFEDIQWVDPSTLDYLELLIDQVQEARILLLLTFRSEFDKSWKTQSNMTHITLNRLTRNQMNELVKGMREEVELPSDVCDEIITRADGIPLFLEELYKMVSESEHISNTEDGSGLPSKSLRDIPMTLKDSLMARLDNIGSSKELAHLGAAYGREFSLALIKEASSLDEEDLIEQLSKLVRSGILVQKGLQPNTRYFFKHHLIQDVAYQSMMKSKRQNYHNKIARILEEKFPDVVNTQPELIALHYSNADNKDNALTYWNIAGKRAIERSAHVEAINHLNAGLRILNTLDENEQRDEKELELLTLLGTALRVTKGFGSPEVQSVYTKAHEVSRRVSEIHKVLPVLRGLGGYYLARAEFSKAHKLGEECFNLANNVDSTNHLLQAHYILGASSFCMGNFNSAKEQLQKGFSLYRSEHHGSEIILAGQDPGTACLFWTSLSLWFLGYPDQALIKAKEALDLSKNISHHYSMAIMYILLAFVHHLRGEPKSAYEYAELAISVSNERGYELFLNFGYIIKGWALCQQGEVDEGLNLIKDGYEEYMNTGTEIFSSYWIAYLAEFYQKIGNGKEGLRLLDKVINSRSEETSYLCQLYRLRGEILLSNSPEHVSQSEQDIRKAIDIARKQKSKSLELKSNISLYNLLKEQGRGDEAKDSLLKIYNWFTEGFDTQDLKEAKSLLNTF